MIVFLLDVKIEHAFVESIVFNTIYFLLGISLWYTVSYNTLEKLAEFLNIDVVKIKDLFVADILVEEAQKYKCSDAVFSVAESQSRYNKEKNVKQSKMKF